MLGSASPLLQAALDRFLRDGLRPIAGKLSFAFNNYMAYQRFDCRRFALLDTGSKRR